MYGEKWYIAAGVAAAAVYGVKKGADTETRDVIQHMLRLRLYRCEAVPMSNSHM